VAVTREISFTITLGAGVVLTVVGKSTDRKPVEIVITATIIVPKMVLGASTPVVTSEVVLPKPVLKVAESRLTLASSKAVDLDLDAVVELV
jgi:hypothetical protein